MGKSLAGGDECTLRCAAHPAFPPLKDHSTHHCCYPQLLGWCPPGSVEGMKILVLIAFWEHQILKCCRPGYLQS